VRPAYTALMFSGPPLADIRGRHAAPTSSVWPQASSPWPPKSYAAAGGFFANSPCNRFGGAAIFTRLAGFGALPVVRPGLVRQVRPPVHFAGLVVSAR